MRVLLEPQFRGEDKKGDGGIRRVCEAQIKYLPSYGVQVIDSEEQADVVALHAGTYVETLKPIVTHCHGLYWKDYEWPASQHQINMSVSQNIKRADAVTVPSPWVANALRNAFWVDPMIIGHGIDPEEWTIGTNEGYVLWNKTRVDKVCTVEEVETLARSAPGVQFVSSFGQGFNIKSVGRQSYAEAKQTVSGAAVYLATAKETFGIGVLEAMACGVPVLGWNWGGQADVVRHKLDGYLAEPGNYEDLVAGLQYCLEHQESLGAEARAHVLSKWTWEQKIEQYANLYKRVESSDGNKRGVSVIIPCFNLGRFLDSAVGSVIKEADEVIIVDDASTDNSPLIAKELIGGKVRLIAQHSNVHVAATLNHGMSEAKYDYVVPLDADNMMAPGALTMMRKALDEDKKIDIVYGSMQCVDEAGNPLTKYGPNGVSGWPTQFKYNGPHTYPTSYCPSTSMYRRKVWERTGGYRTRYKGVEDADFWTRATSLQFVPKKITEEVTFIYRIREDSLSHTEPVVDWTGWYPKVPPAFSTPAKDDIKVSIIIPVGPGHEQLLVDALDSVWNQTYEKWECIVIGDGTPELRLPSWVIQLNTIGKHESMHYSKGPAVARNLGIGAAKGKYIYFLDADDYMQPKTLEMLVGVAGTDKYVYSDWVDHEGNVFTTSDCACKELSTRCPIPISILYPKSAGVMFDERLSRWEDWDFLLALETAGITGLRIAKPLLRYRLDKGLRRRSTESVTEIREKWGEINLACGACGKPVMQMASLSAPTDGSWILMDYINTQQGCRTYSKTPTRTSYRFCTDSSHRTKLVKQEDVEYLLSLGVFRVHDDALVPA